MGWVIHGCGGSFRGGVGGSWWSKWVKIIDVTPT